MIKLIMPIKQVLNKLKEILNLRNAQFLKITIITVLITIRV